MKIHLPSIAIYAVIATTVVFAARGASSAYKEYALGMQPNWASKDEIPISGTGKVAASASEPIRKLPSKAEQLEIAKKLVEKISNGSSKVLEVFTGVQGATGVVIQGSTGAKFVGWVAPGVESLFVGSSFDTNGRNVTQDEMLNRGMAEPSAQPQSFSANSRDGAPQTGTDNTKVASNMFNSLDKSASFVEGSRGPLVYAFIDLNCPSCSEFWKSSRSVVASNRARIRWIPVSILASTSEGLAATLLSSPNPAQTLAEHESRVNGGIRPRNPSAAQNASLRANTELLNMLTDGQMATPILVNKSNTGQLSITRGLPESPEQFWAQLN
jgi:hypothetical protein